MITTIESNSPAFLATRHDRPNDFTSYSADQLTLPLVAKIRQCYPQWSIASMVGEEATKARLHQLMGGQETPELLSTATHGMEFRDRDPRQRQRQGALVCQDCLGPITEDCYFAASDLSNIANVAGLISFHVACYSAGSPGRDDFPQQGPQSQLHFEPIEHQPFLAALPQKLLCHAGGGALAVIGHVERIWTFSFMSTNHIRAERTVFEDMCRRLMNGYPVGYAMELFNQRYAEQTVMLSNTLTAMLQGAQAAEEELAVLWATSNDARNYVIIGDPAVHIQIDRQNK